MKTKTPHFTYPPCSLATATIGALLLLLGLAGSVSAQTLPAPGWLTRALTNRPQFTAPTNASLPRPATNPASTSAAVATRAHIGGLSDEDVAMADAVIAKNTLTLSLLGLGTSVDVPGPLTAASLRLKCLALPPCCGSTIVEVSDQPKPFTKEPAA